MALLIVLLQTLACVGYGALLLRMLGLNQALPWAERAAWAFALGFGILGWLLFYAGAGGALQPWTLAAFLFAALPGLAVLGRPAGVAPLPRNGLVWLLIGGLALVGGLDVVEALAPPVEADSLAYHFELPRRFLEAGKLFFVPRAIDGAVPLLVQMTYLPVLALGGERALTLWTGLSGWGAIALTYVVARRHLSTSWSLTVALLLASTPALLYSAGSGQVETRLILFVVPAAFAAAAALRQGDLRWAALAGLAAGFYMGGKYIGLLFVFATGLVLLGGRGWLRRGTVFSLAALLAGFQWYAWNALHSGDPIFPLLFPWLGDPALWDAAHKAALNDIFFASETPLARTPWNALLYPLIVSLDPAPVMEAGRTGFGPWGLLMLPFAALGVWRYRQALRHHPLAPVAALLTIAYALWFFTGSSQRLRHLLPVYPLFLILGTVAVARWMDIGRIRWPVVAALTSTLALQTAVQVLYAMPYVRHLASSEGRTAFLARSISLYGIVPWINEHLSATDRIAISQRQLLYLIEVPTFFPHIISQVQVDTLGNLWDVQRFLEQVRAQGITHLLTFASSGAGADGGFAYLADSLVKAGCAHPIHDMTTKSTISRTLQGLGQVEHHLRILILHRDECRL